MGGALSGEHDRVCGIECNKPDRKGEASPQSPRSRRRRPPDAPALRPGGTRDAAVGDTAPHPGTPQGVSAAEVPPLSKGRTDADAPPPLAKGRTDYDMPPPLSKGRTDADAPPPLAKGRTDYDMPPPLSKGRTDAEAPPPLTKGPTDVAIPPPLHKGPTDSELPPAPAAAAAAPSSGDAGRLNHPEPAPVPVDTAAAIDDAPNHAAPVMADAGVDAQTQDGGAAALRGINPSPQPSNNGEEAPGAAAVAVDSVPESASVGGLSDGSRPGGEVVRSDTAVAILRDVSFPEPTSLIVDRGHEKRPSTTKVRGAGAASVLPQQRPLTVTHSGPRCLRRSTKSADATQSSWRRSSWRRCGAPSRPQARRASDWATCWPPSSRCSCPTSWRTS